MMRSKLILTVLVLALSGSIFAQDWALTLVDDTKGILPLRKRVETVNRLLANRQKTVLPQVMRETEVDMWIVGRNEGHLYVTLQESHLDGFVGGRSSYMVFFDKGENKGVERIECGDRELADIIKARNPKKVAVNTGDGRRRRSSGGAFSEEQLTELKEAIGDELASRIVNAGVLANRWLGTRSDEEMSVFKVTLRLAHEIIAEAYSNKVIIPDVTTTDDLNWWIRERYLELGLGTHDHPTITIQRSKEERAKYDDDDEYFRVFDERFIEDQSPRCGMSIIIRRGDVIFCDSGIKYLGLYTDTQQAAYVLKEDETDVPAGLKEARRHVIRFQDILGEEMKEGRDGSEAGTAAVERAAKEGIKAKLYSHSLAYYVMRYGMLGGLISDDAVFAGSGMSGSGGRRGGRDNPIRCNTFFALEMDIEYDIPEWNGQKLILFSETGMAFTKRGMEFPGGRETEWHVIR